MKDYHAHYIAVAVYFLPPQFSRFLLRVLFQAPPPLFVGLGWFSKVELEFYLVAFHLTRESFFVICYACVFFVPPSSPLGPIISSSLLQKHTLFLLENNANPFRKTSCAVPTKIRPLLLVIFFGRHHCI